MAFLILLVMLFPNPGCCQPFILLLWGSIASSCTTAPVFSAELFSVQLPSSFYWCMGLFLPRYRTLHFPVWNFCSISIFAEGELGPVVQVINEEVKECWSSLYPWAAALMPGFQLGNALPIPAPGTFPFIQACSLPPRPAWPLLHPPVCVWGCCRTWCCFSYQVIFSKKAVRSVRHYFPFINPCWLIQITFLVPIMFGNGSYENLLPDLSGVVMTLVSL